MSALHLFITLAIATVALSQTCEDWSYDTTGPTSPQNWADICPDSQCGGTSQSPINILKLNVSTAMEPPLKPLTANYRVNTGHTIQNNGHTLFVNVSQSGVMEVTGGPLTEAYELVQIHLHSKSEHTVDGKQVALEVHFVHQKNISGIEYAVVAVMYNVTDGATPDPFIQRIDDETPLLKEVNTSVSLPIEFNMGDVMKHVSSKGYFHYFGSLTTPQCDEKVQWFIMQDIVGITQQQLNALATVPVMNGNFRPVQPIANRTVYHWAPEVIIPRKKAPIGLVIGIIIGGLTCFVLMGIVVLMTTRVGKRTDYDEIEDKD